MVSDFDIAAEYYDTTFTHSNIGKLQRNIVHRFLTNHVLNEQKKLNVLEINCGTGEDANWLAKKGHHVLATDISSKMIEKARLKSKDQKNLEFKILDINNLTSLNPKNKFDLIFSNFGGLNCIDEKDLKLFIENTSQILNKNGKLVMVIMPRNCLWEQFYFLLRGKLKEAFRRNTTNSIEANVDGESVSTWYHNPKQIKNFGEDYFKDVSHVPVGFFVPPSYLERFFKKSIPALKLLNVFEKLISKFSFLSRYSDHYLISLTLK